MRLLPQPKGDPLFRSSDQIVLPGEEIPFNLIDVESVVPEIALISESENI